MKRRSRGPSLLRIEPPHPGRLVRLDARPSARSADHLDQLAKGGVLILTHGFEERPLPIAAFLLLLLPQLALRVFDLGFVDGDGVHVTLDDGGGDFAPGAAALEGVLGFDGGKGEGGGRLGFVAVDFFAGFFRCFRAALVCAEGEVAVPLAFDAVEGVFIVAFALFPHAGGEGVLFAGEPAFA